MTSVFLARAGPLDMATSVLLTSVFSKRSHVERTDVAAKHERKSEAPEAPRIFASPYSYVSDVRLFDHVKKTDVAAKHARDRRPSFRDVRLFKVTF